MKKWVCLLLACTMSLALVACGSGTKPSAESNTSANTEITSDSETTSEEVNEEKPNSGELLTKEDLIEAAEDVKGYEISHAYFENPAKAVQAYCNKILNISGIVSELNEDHAVIDDIVIVYLPIDELANISLGEELAIVGKTSEKTEEVEVGVFGNTEKKKLFVMSPAYITQDHFEIHGWYQAAGIGLKDQNGQRTDNKLRTLKWAEGVDSSQYLDSDITVSAICIFSSKTYDWSYYDATIVE